MASGSAASELVVAKAIETGSATAPMKRRRGSRAATAIGNSTNSRNAVRARYSVASSLNRFTRMPRPMWPTV